MNIIVGTTSKIKILSLVNVIDQYKTAFPVLSTYTIHSYDVESLVPDTPYNTETLRGARNRVAALKQRHIGEADIFIGLESGLVEREGSLFEECWCVIYDIEHHEYLGYSSGFMLPKNVIEEMEKEKTHIEALRSISSNLGLDAKDTWSIYSHGVLSRMESIKEAFRNALLSLPQE